MASEAEPSVPQQHAEQEQIRYDHLPPETIILGFTGPLGSGCSFLAQEIAAQEGYLYRRLSDAIREEARRQNIEEPSVEQLQDIGNELRQTSQMPGHLALEGLRHADDQWATNPDQYHGVVLDGIKNAGEIEVLRQFPNFYLFAIHAERDIRKDRLLRDGRIQRAEDFPALDERDAEERGYYGQQVKRCTYLADFICNNNTQISRQVPEAVTAYLNESVVGKYVRLIKRLARAEFMPEMTPSADEACMTMAYCVSKRSQCMKRQVGALVATEEGTVLSTGFNDVPSGLQPCILDPEWEGCARDRLQEKFAQELLYCPTCGRPVSIRYRCVYCAVSLEQYHKMCPNCGRDPEAFYECECGAEVFKTFVHGADKAYGKLLDMCRSLHAEEIAIIALARRGGGVPGKSVLYTTTFPCTLCARKIVAVGIDRVVYAEPYPMPDARRILENQVVLERFEGVKSSAFFRLYQ